MNPHEPLNHSETVSPGASPQPAAANQSNAQPQMVFVSRPLDPAAQPISDEVRQKHEDCKRKYPELNLSEGEYVISAVKRHPIGLFQVWAVVGFIALILLVVLVLISSGMLNSLTNNSASSMSASLIAVPLLLLLALAVLFGFIQTSVYQANKFFLTNESVIQHIQISLFTKREQTVSLGNVEDASYSQNGIIQSMFDYGMLRLSTQGDETTYRFNYASNPKRQIALLNNAVEAFKNGRRVTGE